MTDIEGGLITLEYAREGLNIKAVVAAQDADITTYVKAATPVIESIVGPVLTATKTRSFTGGSSAIPLPHRVNAVVSVTEDGAATTDYTFDSSSNVLYAGDPAGSRTFADGPMAVVVQYTVGYSTVPQTLQLAARELVRHWWQQGKQSNRPAFDEPVEPVAPPMGFAVPRRVVELCLPFVTVPGFI